MMEVVGMGNPFRPRVDHAAYIGLIMSLVSFGLGLAALSAAVALGAR